MRRYHFWEENFRALVIACVLLIIVLTVGTLGFMYINESYSFVDSIYMTVITLSTVGFSEVHPLTPAGKIFTILLIFSSFGMFGYILSTITRFILDGVFRRNLKDYRVNRKIEKLNNHVIVCGYGRNGRQAIHELLEHGEQVVIIDKSESAIESIRENPNLMYLQGTAHQEDVLEKAGVKQAKALITAIPNDADNVYVALTARELNPKLRIISRSSNTQSDSKLKRAGADNVIMPDRIGGQRMAKLVVQPDVVEFLDFILLQSSKEVKLEEVSCEDLASCFEGKSIRELNVRDKSGANIMGLKDAQGKYVYNPSPEIKLTKDAQLFVLGNPTQIDSLKKLLRQGNA